MAASKKNLEKMNNTRNSDETLQRFYYYTNEKKNDDKSYARDGTGDGAGRVMPTPNISGTQSAPPLYVHGLNILQIAHPKHSSPHLAYIRYEQG